MEERRHLLNHNSSKSFYVEKIRLIVVQIMIAQQTLPY